MVNKIRRIEGFIAGVLFMIGISRLFIAYLRTEAMWEFAGEFGMAVILGGLAIAWMVK